MTLGLDYWNSVTPDQFFEAVAAPENREHVVKTLQALTPDPVWMEVIIKAVGAGQIDVRCCVSWLAKNMRPASYLEVGVRRGFTMAMVASQCPQAQIFGFDSWIKDYANVGNPGPQFVQQELRTLGYRNNVQFYTGNSHETLPRFLNTDHTDRLGKVRSILTGGPMSRPATFDMITIDGDHSLLGAYQDLLDTMPYCSIGGAVIFDDISPDLSTTDLAAVQAERGVDPNGWSDLLGVWHAIAQKFPNFHYFEHTASAPGVGVAIRMS